MFSPEDNPYTNRKGMVGVNVPGNTEVIDVEVDGQSAAGRLARRKMNKMHFEANVSDEDVPLRPSKGQKTSSKA